MRCGSFVFARIAPGMLAAALLATPAHAVTTREIAASLLQAPAPPGLTAIWHDDAEDPAGTLDRLERAGWRVEIALPPHLFYVRETRPARGPLPAGFALREGATRTAASAPALAGPFRGLPFGARWRDTSEFMIGRVAVSILYPESDGTVDPNRYDWTPALRDSVVRAAIRGLAHWTTFAARRGVPLTFALEIHPGLTTRYEPIDLYASQEDLWIQDALTGDLGYRSDALTLAYDAANRARARLGASWGVLLFAVQNDSSSTGQFPDGAISHARMGGPWFVATVKNGQSALQGASLDTYIEHEMAHAFWALDEHLPTNGWWSCYLTAGYFNFPNLNSLVGYCPTQPAQCLMKGNYPDSLCFYTQGQVGWADLDGNGTPDLLETRPAVYPDSDQVTVPSGVPILLAGRAVEFPLQNRNPNHFGAGDSISIAAIDSVLYQIDGGARIQVPPADGFYDSGREYFTAVLPPMAPGTYTVDWEAWNTNGLRSTNNLTTTITVQSTASPAGSGADGAAPAAVRLRAGPTPSGGPIRFALEARPGSRGTGTIHDVHGRALARWPVTVPSSGLAAWAWSGRLPSGATLPSGLYFLSLEVDGTTVKRRLVLSR